MRFVVTGASGFIGSNLVRALLDGGAEVVSVDDRAGGSLPCYLDWSKTQCVERSNFLDWLPGRSGKVDGVFHLGACSDTTEANEELLDLKNVLYSKNVWRICAQEGIPLTYASSAATYGNGSRGWDDEQDPRHLAPMNAYARSKQRFDLWALEQAQCPPRWVGLKYFNVYGPNEWHKGRMSSVALKAFSQIDAEGRVSLFRSSRKDVPHGGQERDFVYVGDAVAATMHMMAAPVGRDAPNGLYNVGTGVARSFADLATAAFAAMGREPRIEYVEMPADLAKKYQYHTRAATRKLRRAGFNKGFLSLEDGVRLYHAYYARERWARSAPWA